MASIKEQNAIKEGDKVLVVAVRYLANVKYIGQIGTVGRLFRDEYRHGQKDALVDFGNDEYDWCDVVPLTPLMKELV